MRPRRLYATKDDRFYYLIKGKKKFIKVPQGMSQKQLQKINITNIIGEQPARRLKRKTKKVVPVYAKKIATKKQIEKNEQKPPPPPPAPPGPGLPVYIFRPQQKVTLDIPEPTVKIETKVKPEPVKTEPVKTEPKVKTETPVFTPVFTPTKVDESLNMIGRTRELLESEMKKDQESINKKLKNPKLKFGAQKNSFPESSEQISPVSRLASIITDEYNKSREFIKQSRLPKGREAPDLPIPTDKEVVKRLKIINNKRDNKLLEQLIQYEYVEPTELQFIINNEPTQLDVWRRLAYNNVGVDKEYEGKDSLQNAMRRKMNEDLKSIGQQLGEGKGKNDGLYNYEIEKIMKKRIKNYVPVVARDKVDELLEYVSNDKFFSAVINTDPSGSSGRHWRCIVIDNRDDFPSAEYFDPLAEDFKPEETLLTVMRKIAKKMNPEKYFKYKFSLIRRQDISKNNCGIHCMKFIEDRHNGIPYSEASGWDDYMKIQKGKGYDAPDASHSGEGDLKSYEKMIKKKFNSYI